MSSGLAYEFPTINRALAEKIKCAQKQAQKTSLRRAKRGISGLPLSSGPNGIPKPSQLRHSISASELIPSLWFHFDIPNNPIVERKGHKRTNSS